ncbi:hypothetical protein B0H17DRAFT_1123587 [Mycena rosella]|uniref:Uncharacterized protein n=1 Tax=Mycena rosella TaxID=1033263 RepID=A0AAD7H318_MYCRO|nr:hypothetical protein B0H17DRAFT_1123587 [Mycena rosella]
MTGDEEKRKADGMDVNGVRAASPEPSAPTPKRLKMRSDTTPSLAGGWRCDECNPAESQRASGVSEWRAAGLLDCQRRSCRSKAERMDIALRERCVGVGLERRRGSSGLIHVAATPHGEVMQKSENIFGDAPEARMVLQKYSEFSNEVLKVTPRLGCSAGGIQRSGDAVWWKARLERVGRDVADERRQFFAQNESMSIRFGAIRGEADRGRIKVSEASGDSGGTCRLRRGLQGQKGAGEDGECVFSRSGWN